MELDPPPPVGSLPQITCALEENMNEDDDEILAADPEARNIGFHLLKADNDLFDEKKNIKERLITIRHLRLAKKKEDWLILENNKVALRLKDYRLSKNEKNFLRSIEGFQFLIAQWKAGVKSVSGLKRQMVAFLK